MEKLAECYLDAPRNLNLPTTPGRQLWFNGGKATVFYEQDLPTVLRRDDLTIYPSERYADWWETWLTSCGEHQPARAKIEVGGIVHTPPYAMLLAQPPLAESTGESPALSAQGAVPAAKKKGRPPKAGWALPEDPHGAYRTTIDPDGSEAIGGLDSFYPNSGGYDPDAH